MPDSNNEKYPPAATGMLQNSIVAPSLAINPRMMMYCPWPTATVASWQVPFLLHVSQIQKKQKVYVSLRQFFSLTLSPIQLVLFFDTNAIARLIPSNT
ncbi:hypothetical protein OUZ56_018647 [Daphnia magna]|uniref:Uncharacterized protein n=1 Tax=Daphnia magna TaxID=35525 RepID=A0ABQ9ZAJ8_9CRUS|nr:hypothetical protein OUZ56_018647 [Daphnia magna]